MLRTDPDWLCLNLSKNVFKNKLTQIGIKEIILHIPNSNKFETHIRDENVALYLVNTKYI